MKKTMTMMANFVRRLVVSQWFLLADEDHWFQVCHLPVVSRHLFFLVGRWLQHLQNRQVHLKWHLKLKLNVKCSNALMMHLLDTYPYSLPERPRHLFPSYTTSLICFYLRYIIHLYFLSSLFSPKFVF